MTYRIFSAGVETPGNWPEVADAINLANEISASENTETKVVHTATDVLVYAKSPVAPGQYFGPWQRVETPKFAAPHFAGFMPAYTRRRIQATVYRKEDKSAWRVHDGRTGGHLDVATTREACHLTSEMRRGRTL